MVQNSCWFWTIICLAGLLGLMVFSIILGINKEKNRPPELRIYSLLIGISFILTALSVSLSFAGLLHPAPFTTLACASITIVCSLCLFFQPALLYGIPAAPLQDCNASPTSGQVPDESALKRLPHADGFEAKAGNPKANTPLAKSNLTIEQSLQYRQLIKDHFSKTLAFRKPGYAIHDLSHETGIPGYLLSMFINQEYGMNFNQFVNAYRVEYLAGLLKTSFNCEAYTLEAIGKMAGFNSRTAFFAAVKKYTGMVPSAFFNQKNHNVQEFPICNFPESMRDVA